MTAITREKIFFLPSTFDASLSFKVESLGEIFLNVRQHTKENRVRHGLRVPQRLHNRLDRGAIERNFVPSRHPVHTAARRAFRFPTARRRQSRRHARQSVYIIYIYICIFSRTKKYFGFFLLLPCDFARR